MKILGIECTDSPVSCDLSEDGKLKAEYFLNLKTTHSQTLLPMVESMLELSDVSIADIDVIAVTAGPGSFTGVRIGISAVKGLAFTHNTPIIPVSVLEAMAYNFSDKDCIVCSLMDARCSQVYNALFEVKDGSVTRLCEDRALMIDEVFADLQKIKVETPEKTIVLVGDGADLFYKTVGDRGVQLHLASDSLKWQRAFGVCAAALIRANNNETVSSSELLPLYLRLPQAERELRSKQQIERE